MHIAICGFNNERNTRKNSINTKGGSVNMVNHATKAGGGSFAHTKPRFQTDR
jgi:hypothetical protein